MRTEADWRSDANSQGQYSEYSEEIETHWVEFTALFDQRRKKESRSRMQMYNILSNETKLSPSTLASFYRHQKIPRETTMDKIIEWIEKKGNKRVPDLSEKFNKVPLVIWALFFKMND
ncbi:hypothetical protein C1645_815048 [Glomus cerebriforme]|uniref:Uncharacterized protein n=1 Tax=Glomus cerebriforme TaxID=658196 RepID=A0A397TEQ5_9GLOM|nr:hypothetical protein C1645_815048 [Glomus cerebriforme]